MPDGSEGLVTVTVAKKDMYLYGQLEGGGTTTNVWMVEWGEGELV